MISVYKSDTGQYVVLHNPSQTVIVDADLNAAFKEMHDYVKEHHPAFEQQLLRPAEQAGPKERLGWDLPRFLLIAVLTVLPFLWLGVLHYTVGSVVDGMMHLAPMQDTVDALRSEVQELRLHVDRLESGAPAPAK